jgi:hypothetical protein
MATSGSLQTTMPLRVVSTYKQWGARYVTLEYGDLFFNVREGDTVDLTVNSTLTPEGARKQSVTVTVEFP